MSHQLILILIGLLFCSWFLIVDRQNFFEKIFMILTMAVVFATYRVLTGVPMNEIFTPIITFINS